VPPRFVLLFFLPLIFLTACATNHPPPPFEIHSADVLTAHHIGTPISATSAPVESSVDYHNARDVHITWFSLEQFNCPGLPLLASKATLITSNLADQAVLPATGLTSVARIAWIGQVDPQIALFNANPSRFFPIGQSRAALPSGVTVTFRALETAGTRDQTLLRPQPRFVEISLFQTSAKTVKIALGVEDYPTPAASAADSPRWPAGVYQYELAILDDPVAAVPQSFLVIQPFQLAGMSNQAVAAFVTIDTQAQDAGFKIALSRCKSDLAANPAAEENPVWTLGLTRAISELDQPDRCRAALVYLAQQGDSSICQDVAMLADDAILADITAGLKRDAPAAIREGNLPQFTWILDESAIAAIQPLLTRTTLPPELFAVLTEHFGEPGRHAAAVDEIMRGTTSTSELRQKLISENYIYLEDSSPASRVRAFNWLAAQHLSPAGFDPLGSPKQRRAALDQALSITFSSGAAQ
jgi:hypothetical protein